MNKNVFIIGSGFSSLSASCYLAKQGYNVTVVEKNSTLGGRARQFKKEGFTFDMGPSWYWMPDVFERFFNDFDKKRSDFYDLSKLDPAYKVFFGKNDSISIEDSLDKIKKVFEKEENGSSIELEKFIIEAKDNYDIAVKDMLYKMPGITPLELITKKTVFKVRSFISNIRREVRQGFKSHRLRAILEFPVLFLGAKASNTPAFYSFMNYADFGLGTWQPKNGFYDVVQSMLDLGKSLGVQYKTECNVESILIENKKVKGLIINKEQHSCDIIISGADYAHTESLLDKRYRQYSKKYWSKKTWAPSSLLFYVGFDKKITDVAHHNLFFDTDFDEHSADIYDEPKWPENPLFYANFTSKTNFETAPDGCENGFFLIPLATDLEDTQEFREKYFNIIIERLEKLTNQKLKNNIIFKESFCVKDFIKDYNSYGGNAYGLANTIMQTAFLRPNLRSNKVKNLYFSGQLTVPGPGVPPAIVSGKLVSDLIIKDEKII
ncbi:phytoene desaturase family protein [Flavobacteriaceae bacterium]|nr:phytoene desaturase family protein [Flavobacteriaceae bacterium]